MVPTRMVYISPRRDKSKTLVVESPEFNNQSSSKQIEFKKINRIVQGHLMTVRDFNKGLQKEHYLED